MRTISILLLTASLSFGASGIVGKWQLSSKDGDGRDVKSVITFREEGDALKATLQAGEAKIAVDRIKRDGDQVVFEIQWKDDLVAINLAPKENVLEGSWKAGDDSGPITGRRAEETTIAGQWKLTATRPNGSTTRVDLMLKADAGVWQATLTTAEGQSVPIEKVTVNDTEVSFNILMPQASIKAQLKLEGAALKGTWATPDQISGPLEGIR